MKWSTAQQEVKLNNLTVNFTTLVAGLENKIKVLELNIRKKQLYILIIVINFYL